MRGMLSYVQPGTTAELQHVFDRRVSNDDEGVNARYLPRRKYRSQAELHTDATCSQKCEAVPRRARI